MARTALYTLVAVHRALGQGVVLPAAILETAAERALYVTAAAADASVAQAEEAQAHAAAIARAKAAMPVPRQTPTIADQELMVLEARTVGLRLQLAQQLVPALCEGLLDAAKENRAAGVRGGQGRADAVQHLVDRIQQAAQA
jgi:hypothetical protein